MYNSEGPQCHWIARCRLLKDFPGDPAVKTLPANAGDVGLIPSLGTKILHGLEQLSLGTTTAEACVPRAGALQREKPLQREARAWLSTTGGRPHTARKTQRSQK